jgi:hypothetical protein
VEDSAEEYAEDGVVTSDRGPSVQCLDGQAFVVRLKEEANGDVSVQCEEVRTSVVGLKQDANGYVSVQREEVRTPWDLSRSAENEIIFGYWSMKDREQNVVRSADEGRAKPERRKSVLFTTLPEVKVEEDDAEMECAIEADDALFKDFLQEIEERNVQS